MRSVNRDSLPHLLDCGARLFTTRYHTACSMMTAWWWGVRLGSGCRFVGRTYFRRHPGSGIEVGTDCQFRSSPVSNLIGVNRPCILSTMKEDATLTVGQGSGFTGTVIACAARIAVGKNVRCGANTLITDTDWHADDLRSGPNQPIAIGDDVWLGVNVTVLKGVTIGQGTLVGAGSLVTKSLPSHVIAAGVPARVIRSVDPASRRIV